MPAANLSLFLGQDGGYKFIGLFVELVRQVVGLVGQLRGNVFAEFPDNRVDVVVHQVFQEVLNLGTRLPAERESPEQNGRRQRREILEPRRPRLVRPTSG